MHANVTTLYRAALGFAIVICATIAGAGLASAAVQGTPPAAAYLAAAPAHHVRTPAQRTCAAFTRWQHKPTAAHLRTLVRDALYAPRKPLGADVLQLAADVYSGAYARGDSTAEQYVYEDCHNGSGA